MIQEGGVKPGEKLPSEVHWSESLGVSRDTIRAALDQLTSEGWVEVRKFQGAFAAVPEETSAPLFETVMFLTRLEPKTPKPDSHFMEQVNFAAQSELDLRHLNCLTLSPRQGASSIIHLLNHAMPAGVLIAHGAGESEELPAVLEHIQRLNLPAVVNGNSPKLAGMDRVYSDHHQGSRDLTTWLIQQGCTSFCRIFEGPESDTRYWKQGRHSGFQEALQEHDLSPGKTVYYQSPFHRDRVAQSKDSFEDMVSFLAGKLVELLSSPTPPDALICGTDGIAFLVSAACRKFGLTPGKDVLIAGYDNYWKQCWEAEFEPNPLTVTVDKHNDRVGQHMVEILAKRLEGSLPPDVYEKKIPSSLVVIDPES
jgi:DNA-binding LacI/PurR family transcriptional regulator